MLMKFLGIGMGSIGQRHFNNLQRLGAGELLAYRQRGKPLRSLNEEVLKGFSSFEEALSQKPDAVLITNPTHLHVTTAIKAAENGCHLFIEKPLSHNMEDVDKLLEMAEGKNLVSLMGCNLRFHPSTLEMKRTIEQGAFGQISSVNVVSSSYLPDWHPWEDYRQSYAAQKSMGGGAILTCIHELDYLYWLFGEVESVECKASSDALGLDVEDTADITLRFRNGVVAYVHLSFAERGYQRFCRIEGGEKSQTFTFSPGKEYDQTYIDEMRHLIRCIKGEERSINDLNDGKRVLEIALAAKQAAKEGKALKPDAISES